MNDIIVKRYNVGRISQDQIHVNFVYAPKTRTLNEIINKAQHTKMPCVSISMGGIRRSPNRVFNKLAGSSWMDVFSKSPSAQKWINLLQPVPVEITVNVSILARFQSDIEQILTNFIPYADPYFVISWRWPDAIPFSDFEIRSTIRWSENVSFQYPLDVAAEASYWTNADTSFTIESWIFKNKPDDGKPIYVIDHSFTAVSAIDTYPVMKSFEDLFNTDVFVISARPQSMIVEPFYAYLGNATIPAKKEFAVIGKMMDYVASVYLSAKDWSMFNYTTTGDFVTAGPGTVDFFTTSSFSASASYPAFSGIPLLSSHWTVSDKNHLNLTFTPQTTGIFDVVLLNGAGYGILSEDCIRPTLNPYPTGSDEYINYVEYQYPCISGVEIRSV